MFVDGEYLDHTFATEPEPLSVIAQIAITGDVLELRNLAAYCGTGDKRVEIGSRQLFWILREICDLAADSGYNYLVITADRHTGANPGRDVLLRRSLR